MWGRRRRAEPEVQPTTDVEAALFPFVWRRESEPAGAEVLPGLTKGIALFINGQAGLFPAFLMDRIGGPERVRSLALGNLKRQENPRLGLAGDAVVTHTTDHPFLAAHLWDLELFQRATVGRGKPSYLLTVPSWRLALTHHVQGRRPALKAARRMAELSASAVAQVPAHQRLLPDVFLVTRDRQIHRVGYPDQKGGVVVDTRHLA